MKKKQKKDNSCFCEGIESCKKCVKKSPLDGLLEAVKQDPLLFHPPELRRAHELEKTDPEEAKRIRENYQRKMHEEIEAKRKDEEDKRNRTGKYDPINIPLGKCRVCKGDIVERLKWVQRGEIRFGGPSNAVRARDCFFCKGCGVVYAFVPKD